MKVKTCLRFPGGKFYGLKRIKPFLNIFHDEYREPFIGGGSVFLSKNLAKKNNWINDIDEDLINFYLIIQNRNSRKKFYELINNEIASKKRHQEVKNMKPEDKIERAFRFFYLNRTSFSGIMVNPRWGYLVGSSVTPDRWIDIVDPVAKKLEKVKITNLDFRKVIEKKSNHDVLMYIDPPYFKASKSIYNHEFKEEDHIDLCKLLIKTDFKFILSYENCDEIKEIYNWANINEIDWTYFMSEGRRQNGKEVIITNFSIPNLEKYIL